MACIELPDRMHRAVRAAFGSPRSIAICVVGVVALVVGAAGQKELLTLGILVLILGVVFPVVSEASLTPTFQFKREAIDRAKQIEELDLRYGIKLRRVAEGLGSVRSKRDWVKEAFGALMDYVSDCQGDRAYVAALCELVRAAESEHRLLLIIEPESGAAVVEGFQRLPFSLRSALVLHDVAGLGNLACAEALHLDVPEYERRVREAEEARKAATRP